MTNLEMLRTGTPEQIADMFCDMLGEKGPFPVSLQWIGAALLYTALLMRNI